MSWVLWILVVVGMLAIVDIVGAVITALALKKWEKTSYFYNWPFVCFLFWPLWIFCMFMSLASSYKKK